MRIVLTALLIAAGVMADARLPEADAATPAPYEATLIPPAALHFLSGEKDCNPVWDV